MTERVIALIMAAATGIELAHRHWFVGVAMFVGALLLNETGHEREMH